ncbi:MAG TPA: LLM class flavin-dependent oxidoreductase [Candidatus Lustribacter sp.]|jgi:alkanesulfonate monooxygenase SsuD/methylene tetrahydromethanopterin reductase-like flavin-dependent oxidoreductase (luciferase family)|nr:LLM class flavin-dependent oxidoreductase [Candidatus Lustribacter sp.]
MMKFGAFDHIDRGIIPTGDLYEERLRLAEAYDSSGWIHAYHMAEHHGTPLGKAPSPPVFLAALSQRTKTLRFGAMVFCLAAYHPYRFYEELCMLDHLSRGRLELGIGRGVSPIELSFLGISDMKVADTMYAESLDVLFRLFDGGVLNFTGEHYRFDNVPIEMQPFQKPRPPLWYGIGSPGTAVWAAKHGVNLMSNLPPDGVRVLSDRYRLEWASAGRDPREFPFFGSTKFTVVADTDAEAVALARSAYAMYSDHTQHLARMYGTRKRREWLSDFDEARAAGLIAAGSPRTVRDYLANFIDESGINYLAVRIAFGDLSLEQSLHSLDLLTEHVFPDLAELAPAVA